MAEGTRYIGRSVTRLEDPPLPRAREPRVQRQELVAFRAEPLERMLGVADNPLMTRSDQIMKAIADDMGVGHTFRLTPVGVFFGEGPGVRSPDPFFGGAGPDRTGCIQCGECMTGCRYNA